MSRLALPALLAACRPARGRPGACRGRRCADRHAEDDQRPRHHPDRLPRRAPCRSRSCNQAGQPVGFSVDLCHGIAEDVADALNRDLLEPDAPAWQSGVRIVYVPVAADERLPNGRRRRDRPGMRLDDRQRRAGQDRRVLAGVLPGRHQAAGAGRTPRHRVLSRPRRQVGRGRRRHHQRRGHARAWPPRATPPIEVVETAEPGRRVRRCWPPARPTRSPPTTSCWPASSPRKPDGTRFRVVGDYPVLRALRDRLPPRRSRTSPRWSGASFARMAGGRQPDARATRAGSSTGCPTARRWTCR